MARTYYDAHLEAILMAGKTLAAQYPRCATMVAEGSFPCGPVCACDAAARTAITAYNAAMNPPKASTGA